MARRILLMAALCLWLPPSAVAQALEQAGGPYLVVLGIAQDAGVPQAGTRNHPGWDDPAFRRSATSLALVDPASGGRWLFEATPDLPEQLNRLDGLAPVAAAPGLDGIFLTHAHIGHYTGLMYFGHEAMGARGVPVYALPRMRRVLRKGAPWSQLVRYGNIELRRLKDGARVALGDRLHVTPFRVPHRKEHSEVAGFRIEGPKRSVLFLPDIDSWEEWDSWGVRLEDVLESVDVAYLDATFYADGEIPGRDMSEFPHPFITHTMRRLADLPESERAKVRFIHLNHTNPALWENSDARRDIERKGFRVAEEGERLAL